MATDIDRWRMQQDASRRGADLPLWLRMLPMWWTRGVEPVVDTVPTCELDTVPQDYEGGAMRIYTDKNGLTVEAINTAQSSDGPDGHTYLVNHGGAVVAINFQFGPVKEFGLNGLTTEALLEICRHRLAVLNEPPYRCFQNAKAIAAIADALAQLEDWTREREARGVEGTSKA